MEVEGCSIGRQRLRCCSGGHRGSFGL